MNSVEKNFGKLMITCPLLKTFAKHPSDTDGVFARTQRHSPGGPVFLFNSSQNKSCQASPPEAANINQDDSMSGHFVQFSDDMLHAALSQQPSILQRIRLFLSTACVIPVS